MPNIISEKVITDKTSLWAGLILSLAAGLVLQGLTGHLMGRELKARFDKAARSIEYNIDADIKAYTGVLHGAASLLQAGDATPGEHFRRYVHGLDRAVNFPAIASVNFAAPPSPECETGAPRAVPVPLLAPGGRPQAALALWMPVHRADWSPADPLHLPGLCIGSVGIVLNVERLMLGALAGLAIERARLTLHEMDVGSGAGSLLYDSAPAAEPAADGAAYHYRFPIKFSGRLWNARLSAPSEALYSRIDVWLPWLALVIGFSVSGLVYLIFHTLLSSRRRAMTMAGAMTRELRLSQFQLQQSHDRLRRQAAHAEQVKEQERKRIAREIHDDLGQNLLALRMEAEALASRTGVRHVRLHYRAHQTLVQIDNAIRSVRQIINDLRPNVLDLSLGAAVEWQISQFRKRSGLICELYNELSDDDCGALGDDAAIAFFRILQESLNNIVQHAHASAVWVSLGERDGMLCMTISDNGVGLHQGSRSKRESFGLLGIEERIRLLAGHCAITRRPGGGTAVRVTVAMARSQPAEEEHAAAPA